MDRARGDEAVGYWLFISSERVRARNVRWGRVTFFTFWPRHVSAYRRRAAWAQARIADEASLRSGAPQRARALHGASGGNAVSAPGSPHLLPLMIAERAPRPRIRGQSSTRGLNSHALPRWC
jgi:hypothetical protein